MRKISKTQRRYTWKDFFKMIGILLGHFFALLIYIIILNLIDYYALNAPFIAKKALTEIWLIYFLIAAPLINGISQIIYSETGKLAYKAILWIHFTLVFIFAPIVIFAF